MVDSVLKGIRELSGLSQIEFAKKLGINYSTYQSYEYLQTGTAKNIDTILEVALDSRFSKKMVKDGKALSIFNEIDRYRFNHPEAQWNEIYQNIENHYKDSKSMAESYRRRQKRKNENIHIKN